MSQQPTATTVRHSVVVDAPIDKAFKVFTEDFGRFKPAEHNMLGVDIAETVFEPRVGGSLYDRGVDGSECRWARVLAYEPPSRVVLSWDISPYWQIETDPAKTSEFPISRPAVSQHLRVLKDAGLVTDEAVGNRRVYRADPVALGALRDQLDRFWSRALEAYKVAVEQTDEEDA